MDSSLLPVVRAMVGILVPLAGFVAGLQTPAGAVRWLRERGRLLVGDLFTILVLVPAVTVAVLQILPLPIDVRAGLLVVILAVGVGPVTTFRRSAGNADVDRRAHEVSLNVLLLLAAIAYVPVFSVLHGAVFGHSVRVNAGAVAGLVITRALLPLALGIVVARLLPHVAERMRRPAGWLVNGLLAATVGIALVATWPVLSALGAAGWGGCVLVAALAVIIGDLMGGPSPDNRITLATFAAMRFPALALLIAAAIPQGRRVVPIVLAYVIVSAIIAGGYSAVLARRAVGAAPRAPAHPATAPA